MCHSWTSLPSHHPHHHHDHTNLSFLYWDACIWNVLIMSWLLQDLSFVNAAETNECSLKLPLPFQQICVMSNTCDLFFFSPGSHWRRKSVCTYAHNYLCYFRLANMSKLMPALACERVEGQSTAKITYMRSRDPHSVWGQRWRDSNYLGRGSWSGPTAAPFGAACYGKGSSQHVREAKIHWFNIILSI